MADEQTPPNPSDAPVPSPEANAGAPVPDPAGEIAETLKKAEKSAASLASDTAKGSVPPELTEKANDMLAAARAAIAAAQTAQAGGMPPPGAAPQPDLSGIAEQVSGSPVALPDFSAPGALSTPSAGGRDIDLLGDVNLNVKIELGRTRMLVEDVLRLGEGSVVELDKLAGDPVDVFVNGRHVARGEVLVVNDNFCVRISEILSRVPGSED